MRLIKWSSANMYVHMETHGKVYVITMAYQRSTFHWLKNTHSRSDKDNNASHLRNAEIDIFLPTLQRSQRRT